MDRSEVWHAPCKECGGEGDVEPFRLDIKTGPPSARILDLDVKTGPPRTMPCPTCKAAKEVMLVAVSPCPQSSEMGCLQPVSDEYCNKYGEGVCELTRPLTVSEVEEYRQAISVLNGINNDESIYVLHKRGELPNFKGQPVRVAPMVPA